LPQAGNFRRTEHADRANSFFGRIGPGLAAEYFGRFNTFIALGCLSTGLIFGLWIPGNNVPSAIAFSACFGFTSGCAVSLGPTLVFQISELRMMVWNMALLYVLQSSAALVSSPLGGALLGAGPTPLYLQVFTGSLLAAGTIFFILARVDQSGFALWKII
jgi:MFS family permease